MHQYEELGEEGVEDLSYRKRLNLAGELDEVAFKLHTWSDHSLAVLLASAGAVVMEDVDEDSPIEASALKASIENRLKAYQLLEIVSTQDDAIAAMHPPRRAHCAAQLYGRATDAAVEWTAADDAMRLQLLSIASRFCCPPPLSAAATAAATASASASSAASAAARPPPECADEASEASPPAGTGGASAAIALSVQLERVDDFGFGLEFVPLVRPDGAGGTSGVKIIQCSATENSAMQPGDELTHIAHVEVASMLDAATALQECTEDSVVVEFLRHRAPATAAEVATEAQPIPPPQLQPAQEPVSAEEEAAANAKIHVLQGQIDTATEQLYSGDRTAVRTPKTLTPSLNTDPKLLTANRYRAQIYLL